jgi:hypothetical protein
LTKFTVFFLSLFITAGLFTGGCVSTGNNSSPSNLTLWEKSQTPNHYSMCMNTVQEVGYFSVYSPGNDRIKNIFFRIATGPGMVVDLKKTTFTVSTANYSRTLHPGDKGLFLSEYNQTNLTLLDQYNMVDLEFNLTEMGFTDETFGPDQRFVIAIVSPEDGHCNNVFSGALQLRIIWSR